MKEISKEESFTIISNGKEAFLYALAADYWDNDSDSVSDRLESEGWAFVEQSNEDGEYMWDLYKKHKSSDSPDYLVPKTLQELQDLIKERVTEQGPNCDLNDIDTSNITDMSWLFRWSKFNGDISKWDVSHVTDMRGMFCNSKFTGDISNWDVSHVTDMSHMFEDSQFNGDISNWDISNVIRMRDMFRDSQFNGDISNWDISPRRRLGLKK